MPYVKHLTQIIRMLHGGGGIINFDVLIVNCNVITMDKSRRVLKGTCIGIISDKIVYIGDFNENFNAAKVIKGLSKVAMPGFIDSHAHAGQGLIRNIIGGMTSKEENDLCQCIYHKYTTQSFWFFEAMLSGIEKLKFGITTGVSFLGADMRFDELAYAEAHVEGMLGVGVRDVLCVGSSVFPFPKKFMKWDDMKFIDFKELYFEDSLSYMRNVVKRFNRSHSEFIYCYPTASFLGNDMEINMEEAKITYNEIKNISEEYGTNIHSHSYPGEIKFLNDNFNFLDDNVFITDCSELSNEEIDILSNCGASVCFNPFSHMIKTGKYNAADLMNSGVNTTLCTNAGMNGGTYDLLEKTRIEFQRQGYLSQGNFQIKPENALEMITINAAKALGLDNITGSIEVGKKADIALIDMEKPHLCLHYSEPESMVYQADGQDVDTVIVNGRVLMEGRKLTQLNEKKILASAKKEAQKILLRRHQEVF